MERFLMKMQRVSWSERPTDQAGSDLRRARPSVGRTGRKRRRSRERPPLRRRYEAFADRLCARHFPRPADRLRLFPLSLPQMAFRNDDLLFEVSTPPFSRMKMMGALPFVFDAGPEPTRLATTSALAGRRAAS